MLVYERISASGGVRLSAKRLYARTMFFLNVIEHFEITASVAVRLGSLP